ncbi:hypothetical protein [Leptospira sp. 'Mane']|uniref:hypothetical protein n=1 Tax=Leptospira sp. 'Mane' TaxID=3387407 RepID=UPI00398A66B0
MRNLSRRFVMCGLFLLFGFSFGCKNESKSTDDVTNLLLFRTIAGSSSATLTTIYNSSGVAGRDGTLSISDVSKSPGTLTVNGVSIPVTCCNTSFGLKFTTPVFSGITENTKFDAVFVSSAGVSYSGSFLYYILPTLTENIPNSFNRTIPSSKSSDFTVLSTHYYKYIPSSTVTLANVSGYTGNSSLSIGITNPTSTTDFRTFSSATNFSNTAYLKMSGAIVLTAGTTYDLKITNTGSTTVSYKIGVANQAISNGASCNIHTTYSRCVDYLVNDSASQADCALLGTYNAAQTCTGLALGTVVGRCTIPSATNIATIYYYSNGGAAFNAGTAATDCNAKSNSIFQ